MLEIQSSSRGQQKFFIFIQQKNLKKFFIFILCLKSIGRYRLYLPIPILLADTTKIGRYHRYRYRYSSIGTSLFGIQLDKSVDCANLSQLITFVRYIRN